MSSETVSSQAPAVRIKETIPLWIAVGITVAVSVPFTLWLSHWNLAVWCSFIVWAEYFALGAKPAAARTILPAFATSAIGTAILLAIIAALNSTAKLVTAGDIAVIAVLGVGCGGLVYLMKFWQVLQSGSLPFFNGISMVLAVYFTTSFPHVTDQASLTALWAGVWTVVLGAFGVLLGMFNVWLTFPKDVRS
ncbi:MAG: DUF1097 family protein [Cellulomonas sp.]|uniref:DUF1097 family protein n=1 Tax=Cellulomonas sp. 73-92 TaxID=1895740 RepID=UPI000AE7857B|nr:DUF1097 family protein [Cellulomonas sp. 73-92]MBN9376598.1 DUF1097 family protein [Cellulomonas sp.]